MASNSPKEPAEDAKHHMEYQTLLPVLLSDEEFEQYQPHFDVIFNRDDPPVLNVAITGSYGAGKSSVIRTFDQRKDSKREYLYVSVSQFITAGTNPLSDEARQQIESHLINQLIHKVDDTKVPKSRFRHTQDRTSEQSAGIAIIVGLFFLAYVALTYLTGRDELGSFGKDAAVLASIVCGIIATVVAYYAIKHDLIRRFLSGLSFMGLDVSVEDGKTQTLFDQYLNDILYLLDNSDVDVVVFEDLDRYNMVTPFEDLREINDLVNVRRSKRGGRPLRFIYLIRDSLFENPSDKLKFFDYSFPVISYVDSNNSFSLMRNRLSFGDITPSDKLLRELSSFIHDPRILAQIENETCHYYTALFATLRADIFDKNDADKLLAIMAYKILFPADYERLQHGCGFVYSLLSLRPWMVDRVCKKLGSDLKKKRKAVWSLQQDVDDVKERGDELPVGLYMSLNEARRECERLEREMVQVRYQEFSQLVKLAGFGTAANRVMKKAYEYNAEDKSVVRPLYKEEVLRIQHNHYYPLLRSLIEGGYIDESYPRYCSSYQGVDLSHEDQGFIRNLRSHNSHLENVPLVFPKAVIDAIDISDLKRRSARNYSLFRGLIDFGPKAKLLAFVESLNDGDAYEFIVRYVSSAYYSAEMFKALRSKAIAVVRELPAYPANGSVETVYCQRLLEYIGDNGILQFADYPEGLEEAFVTIRDQIDYDDRILDANVGEVSRNLLLNGLKLAGYQAAFIDFERADARLLSDVYTAGMYGTYPDLIQHLLIRFEGESEDLELASIIPALRRHPNSTAYQKVDADFEMFLTQLLEDDIDELYDCEADVAWVLNRDLDAELAEIYVSSLVGTPIRSLDILDSSNYGLAMQSGIVYMNAHNLEVYYGVQADASGDDGIAPLEPSIALVLSSFDPSMFDGFERPDVILQALAMSEEVPDDFLERVARYYKLSIKSLAPSMSDERVSVLVKSGCVAITPETMVQVRRWYPVCVEHLCATNPRKYSELLLYGATASQSGAVSLFDADEAERLLAQGLMTGTIADGLLARLSNLSVKDGLNSKTIQELVDKYETYSKIGRHELIRLLCTVMLQEPLLSIELPYELLLSVMVNPRFDNQTAVLAAQLNMRRERALSLKEISALLYVCGFVELAVCAGDGPVTIERTKDNAALVTGLAKVGYCTELRASESGITVLPVLRRYR